MSNEEYIKITKAGKTLLELNAYYDYVIAGNPPDKTQKEVEEMKKIISDEWLNQVSVG